jgi:hypothetical protein
MRSHTVIRRQIAAQGLDPKVAYVSGKNGELIAKKPTESQEEVKFARRAPEEKSVEAKQEVPPPVVQVEQPAVVVEEPVQEAQSVAVVEEKAVEAPLPPPPPAGKKKKAVTAE